MGETSMKGTRLGTLSLECDDHVQPAERRVVRYVCPEGHVSNVPYFVDADEIQREWTCRCGATAIADEIAPVPLTSCKVLAGDNVPSTACLPSKYCRPFCLSPSLSCSDACRGCSSSC